MKPIINITDLSVGYNKKAIIAGFQHAVNQPAFISLIGRNGEGKSTLLKTISGLIPAVFGSISFSEKQLSQLAAKEKAMLFSVVLTLPPQIGTISVWDFVSFGRYPYNNWLAKQTDNDKLIINEALVLCGIEAFAQRNYAKLSDGEKQKVALARAIAQQTPIIILDEPTTHLDMVNQLEIFELLKKLVTEKQKTILLSTHQVQMSIHFSDEIWLLNKGKIEAKPPSYFIKNKTFEQLFNINLSTYLHKKYIYL